jgi:hypothetical protein
LPVVYNPQTTHIFPQFHVIFVNQFTTVHEPAHPDNFYNKLFDTTKWTYDDAFVDAFDLHYFNTTWSDLLLQLLGKNIMKTSLDNLL